MRRLAVFLLTFGLAALLIQCQSSTPPTATSPAAPTQSESTPGVAVSPSTPPVALKTAGEMAALGDQVYKKSCGRCHDDPFAGPLSNGLQTYNNAMDLFRFMQSKMPQDNPGSLPAEQYLQVLARVLIDGGVLTPSSVLDSANLAAITFR